MSIYHEIAKRSVAVGAATVASEQAEAMYIGAGAKTFVKAAQEMAESLEKKGFEPSEIWQKTGSEYGAPMLRGADGKWRQEISDDEAYLLRHNGETFVKHDPAPEPLEQILHHDKLYDAYPDLKKVSVGNLSPASDALATYAPRRDQIRLKPNMPLDETLSSGLHEIQHAIQQRENFATGSSPDIAMEQIEQAKRDRSNSQYILDDLTEIYSDQRREMGAGELLRLKRTANIIAAQDQLKGYLEGFYSGGKLTDKRRHIFNAGAGAMEHNAEYKLRMGIGFAKKHRSQRERDLKFAEYIYGVLSKSEQSLDPIVAQQVRSETVKNAYKKYERQLDKIDKKLSYYPKRIREERAQRNGLDRFLARYDVNQFSRFNLYKDTAGEVEARSVQERMGKLGFERERDDPFQSGEFFRTPIADQVVTSGIYPKVSKYNSLKNKALTAGSGSALLGDKAFSEMIAEREETEVGQYPTDAVANYNRSNLTPMMGVMAQGAVENAADTADYFGPLNLGRLILNPGNEGLGRFLDSPVGTPKRDAVRPITDSVLLDKRDPKYDQMVEEAKGIGALLSF